MKTKEELYDLYLSHAQNAEWETTDRVDPYTIECNISLNVDGYEFAGYGSICSGEKDIESLVCICPDGTTVSII